MAKGKRSGKKPMQQNIEFLRYSRSHREADQGARFVLGGQHDRGGEGHGLFLVHELALRAPPAHHRRDAVGN
eukprot:5153950-Prymnesium_polylepis.1